MAATVFNAGSGNWNAASTWQGGKVPTPLDDVVLAFADPAHPTQTYQVDLADGDGPVHNLTIIDDNVLNVAADALLAVDLMVLAEDSKLTGSARVQVGTGIHNNGAIEASSGNLRLFGNGYLLNTGTILAPAGSSVTIDLDNAGSLANVGLAATSNSGLIHSENGSWIQISGTISNTGLIESHGHVTLLGPVTNSADGQLVVDGGMISAEDVVTDGRVVLSNGGEFEITGTQGHQSTTTVEFAGPGNLFLRADGYGGTIQGLGSANLIVVEGLGYKANSDYYDAQSGLLVVVGNTHTITLRLDGTYSPDDFTFASGGRESTVILFSRFGQSAPSTIDTADLELASLYVGYFGRAGDPAGLAYWHDKLVAGHETPGSLSSIAASFSVQAEAQAAYPLLADPQHAAQAEISSFIGSVYENLFGRTPDAPGAAYWQGQLGLGAVAAQRIGAFVLDVISGAQGADAATIAHRSEVAAFFTDHLAIAQLPYDAAADALARDALDDVTSDGATVIAAQMAVSGFIDQQLLQLAGILES